MSGNGKIVVGSVVLSPNENTPAVIDSMAESIVRLSLMVAELEQERDFYKAAATKLSKPAKRRRKQ
jgi:hypothetical protein